VSSATTRSSRGRSRRRSQGNHRRLDRSYVGLAARRHVVPGSLRLFGRPQITEKIGRQDVRVVSCKGRTGALPVGPSPPISCQFPKSTARIIEVCFAGVRLGIPHRTPAHQLKGRCGVLTARPTLRKKPVNRPYWQTPKPHPRSAELLPAGFCQPRYRILEQVTPVVPLRPGLPALMCGQGTCRPAGSREQRTSSQSPRQPR
jgi:hypothetical protein